MNKIKAWHFSNKQGTLGYGDGRQIVLGETLSVDGIPVKCHYGLHGSKSILDAMGYASGCRLWRVEIWEDIDSEDDKLCGKNRKALIDYGDIMPLIVKFAKSCSDRAQKHAKYAKYAKSAKYAKYAAESAAKSAKYAKYAAKSAAKKERKIQEEWWAEKLEQLKGGRHE
jgi:hypothetical protein